MSEWSASDAAVAVMGPSDHTLDSAQSGLALAEDELQRWRSELDVNGGVQMMWTGWRSVAAPCAIDDCVFRSGGPRSCSGKHVDHHEQKRLEHDCGGHSALVYKPESGIALAPVTVDLGASFGSEAHFALPLVKGRGGRERRQRGRAGTRRGLEGLRRASEHFASTSRPARHRFQLRWRGDD
jgi:hypothetical protein